jgi:preprotein translocase subunit SecE
VNRESKRTLQRQGQLGSDGSPSGGSGSRPPGFGGAGVAGGASRPSGGAGQAEHESLPQRTGEYLREVRSELVKVAWPGRPEVINYTIVVFVTLVLLTAIVFGLNYLVGHGVFLLFPTRK